MKVTVKLFNLAVSYICATSLCLLILVLLAFIKMILSVCINRPVKYRNLIYGHGCIEKYL